MAAEVERGSAAPRWAIGLGAILLVAGCVRAFAWSRTAVMFNDGPIFLAMAEAIGEGRWAEVLAHPYHPLYPAMIAIVRLFSVELESAAVIVSIFGGLISVAAVFWFVRDAFGLELAWPSAWVVALHPWAVDFSSDIMSDGLYAGLFLLGFVAMARVVDDPKLWTAVFCGTAGGLAYLVRPEGAGLLVACVCLLVGRAFFDSSRRQSYLGASAIALLAGSLMMLPFIIAVGQQTGEFVLTQKKSISTLAGAQPPAQVGRPRTSKAAEAPVLSEPLPLPELAVRAEGEGARRPPRNGWGVLEALMRVTTTSMAAFRFELIFFAALGLWATRSDRKPWREATLAVPIILYSGLLLLLVWGAGYVGRRHALAPWLPVVAVSVLGWRYFWTKLTERALASASVSGWRDRLAGQRVATIVLVLLLVVSWGARDLRPRRLDRAQIRTAAEWLARHHPQSGAVAAQKLRTAYYADTRYVPLPPGHDGLIAEYLRRRSVRWVIIDAARLDDHRGLAEGIGRWLRRTHRESFERRTALVLEVLEVSEVLEEPAG